LLGLLGTVLGCIRTFDLMQDKGVFAHVGLLTTGVSQALVCAAAGLAVAIPAHAGYNYLVSRVNSIVLDMERAATEIVNIVTENATPSVVAP
jgi:biopolymer transport protein ExbB